MHSTTCDPATRFVFRLGRHHFAHLRAIAHGLDLLASAQRYLGIEHGNEAQAASRQTADAARAIARRRNEPAWRLIGLTIALQADDDIPTLEDYIEQRGLDGWSESEVAQMYAEAYPASPKAEKRQRLRQQQLELLKRLEALEAEQPLASDLVAGWFDSVTAERLIGAGLLTLGALNQRIAAPGLWYQAMPGIGHGKAQKIAAHLATLLPPEARAPVAAAAFSLVPITLEHAPALAAVMPDAPIALPSSAAQAVNLARSGAGDCYLLAATTDIEAVTSWIQARAGSAATAKSYQREARRLLLWLQYERSGRTLAAMQIEDCSAFMAFLQNIPSHWISRARAMPFEPGWAPFRGKLSHDSQKQAIVIVAALFTWLQAARYLHGNPFVLVNKKTGDDSSKNKLDSRALSAIASSEITRFIDDQPPSPSSQRIRFIVHFVECVGLRSTELLSAHLGDFRLEAEGLVMQAFGKGSKLRNVAIPRQAARALDLYLQQRGLGSIELADPALPLVPSLTNVAVAVGYLSFYEHVTRWLRKAIDASALSAAQRKNYHAASPHWLRHTFGTNAVAKGVPYDVIQAQMGHASIQTTMDIYGRAPIRRRVDELNKAFDGNVVLPRDTNV
jgi:site-specific recombinase XerD